jgi:hypothetical protein
MTAPVKQLQYRCKKVRYKRNSSSSGNDRLAKIGRKKNHNIPYNIPVCCSLPYPHRHRIRGCNGDHRSTCPWADPAALQASPGIGTAHPHHPK